MTDAEMRFEIARLAGLLAASEGGYAPRTARMLRRIADRLEAVPKAPKPHKPPRVGFWTPERIADLNQLRADGHSFGRIAKLLGCTRNMAMAKHGRLMRAKERVPMPFRPRVVGDRTAWSESALTETWADRKARRQAEREQ